MGALGFSKPLAGTLDPPSEDRTRRSDDPHAASFNQAFSTLADRVHVQS